MVLVEAHQRLIFRIFRSGLFKGGNEDPFLFFVKLMEKAQDNLIVVQGEASFMS